VSQQNELAQVFIAAAVAEGFSFNPDYNSGDQDGFGYIQLTQKSGRRWSAADAYLHPAGGRPNLEVLTDAKVLRLELKDTRCVGAIYERGGRQERIAARVEVILAAGTMQSPQLLELSGIGNPEVLSRAGMTVIHALPGVGGNYRDHFAPRLSWRIRKPVTLNDKARGLPLVGELLRYAISHKGALSLPPVFALGFVRSRLGLVAPDIQYHFLPLSFEPGTRKLEREPGMTINLNAQRPTSVGSIHIVSSDPHAAPCIRSNFLDDEEDRRTIVEGFKIARRIVANPAFDPYRAFEMLPGDAVHTNDEYLDYARATGVTTYHPIGTCRMGQDPKAVVDNELRVHGISGLRIVDASIMPTLVSGNTHAPVIMIAERAAELIKTASRIR
jgi:choline dehydrogenase